MKKIVIMLLGLILIVGCTNKEVEVDYEEKTDAIKFKEEYESLNNSDDQVRNIEISEDNPIIYKDASDIVDMINNKETFLVYFGFATCPWCRSILPTLLDVANDYNYKTIYYVDVYDIRDTLELSSDGSIITKVEGSSDYYKLLELFDNILDDYTLIDSNNNEMQTGKKRIYAPNVISVIDGEAKELETGISNMQTDAYMELTEDIISDTYNKFEYLIKCIIENKTTCVKANKC